LKERLPLSKTHLFISLLLKERGIQGDGVGTIITVNSELAICSGIINQMKTILLRSIVAYKNRICVII
jgi:hypothetical protein